MIPKNKNSDKLHIPGDSFKGIVKPISDNVRNVEAVIMQIVDDVFTALS